MIKRIGIIGGGPAGLFVYKRIVESGRKDLVVDVFESATKLGAGMPYSDEGANKEHITNVSGNEIPQIKTEVGEWIEAEGKSISKDYDITRKSYNDFKVLPRLLFGEYLHSQFDRLIQEAERAGITTKVHLNSKVTDVIDLESDHKVAIEWGGDAKDIFDVVIVATGHYWPKTYEGIVPGYYDSPYPPAKLRQKINHAVSITGAGLTAIDAVRTLARANGKFVEEDKHRLRYEVAEGSEGFKIVMHSLHGLLPAVRFHLEDPHLSKSSLVSEKDIAAHMKANDGFLSLDFLFEKDFKDAIKRKDPGLYERIKDMSIEAFVEYNMAAREAEDPFVLFKREYEEAAQSIKQRKSIYWKEALTILSFAMNYPAKHFSAEDMLRLQKVLMPLISIVIAFVPQRSCEEMLALHEAGRLTLIPVNEQHEVKPEAEGVIHIYTDEAGEQKQERYQLYINAKGQRHLNIGDLPFKSIVSRGTVSEAMLPFRDPDKAGKLPVEQVHISGGNSFLRVPGITITDNFNVVGPEGNANPRIYMMAVPFIGGYNPDYSGLDFCEEASGKVVQAIFSKL